MQLAVEKQNAADRRLGSNHFKVQPMHILLYILNSGKTADHLEDLWIACCTSWKKTVQVNVEYFLRCGAKIGYISNYF